MDLRLRCAALRSAGLLALSFAAFGAVPAVAQEPPPDEQVTSNVSTYKPDFFTEYRPNTAMDMISRIPGFSFDGGSFARGFAGTAGNVLIDGARPPSRNDSLSSVLTRIPASSVERIDVIRGGAPGIDMQGKPIVANVIRKPGGGIKGAAAVSTGFNETGPDFTNTQFQVNREKNGRTVEGELALGRNQGLNEGDRIRLDPAGVPILRGELHQTYNNANQRATGSFETPFVGGKLRLNGLASHNRNSHGGQEVLTLPGGAEMFGGDNESFSGEAGLRYSRDLANGMAYEAVLFQQLSKSESESIFNTPGFTSTTLGESRSGESIGGVTLTLPNWKKFAIETGVETVFNFNENSSAFGFNGSPISLAGDAVRVEELRTNAFVTSTWTPTAKLSIVGGVNYEQSTISASGTAGGAEKTLRFVKPRINVSWTPRTGHQFGLRIERVVDQLSFGAFSAAANFSTGVFGIGNPDLEPEKAWLIDGRYEYKFGRQGSFVVNAVHRETEDVLSRVVIVIPATATDPIQFFDITRNLGTATRSSINISARVPLDNLGMAGGILNARIGARTSHTIDPVTGIERRVSNDQTFDWNIGLSQTLQTPPISWSLNAHSGGEGIFYGTRGISTFDNTAGFGGNIGWKPRADLNLGAGFNSGSDNHGTFTFFSLPRNIATVPIYTESSRNFGRPNVYINARKSF